MFKSLFGDPHTYMYDMHVCAHAHIHRTQNHLLVSQIVFTFYSVFTFLFKRPTDWFQVITSFQFTHASTNYNLNLMPLFNWNFSYKSHIKHWCTPYQAYILWMSIRGIHTICHLFPPGNVPFHNLDAILSFLFSCYFLSTLSVLICLI